MYIIVNVSMFYSSSYFYLISLSDRVDLKIRCKNFVIKLSVDILPSLVTLLKPANNKLFG